jgi:DNA-directed RNA polymerase subunit RPC12/RpoP
MTYIYKCEFCRKEVEVSNIKAAKVLFLEDGDEETEDYFTCPNCEQHNLLGNVVYCAEYINTQEEIK